MQDHHGWWQWRFNNGGKTDEDDDGGDDHDDHDDKENDHYESQAILQIRSHNPRYSNHSFLWLPNLSTKICSRSVTLLCF